MSYPYNQPYVTNGLFRTTQAMANQDNTMQEPTTMIPTNRTTTQLGQVTTIMANLATDIIIKALQLRTVARVWELSAVHAAYLIVVCDELLFNLLKIVKNK